MQKVHSLKKGFVYSFSIVAYVILIASILQSSNSLFGQSSDVLAPIAMLLLFVVSAAIVGSLMFGEPIYLLINGDKKESLMLGAYTGGFLIADTIIFLIILAIVK